MTCGPTDVVRCGAASAPSTRSRRSRIAAEHVAKYFPWLVWALTAGFLLLQLRYIWGLPLIMDEFANAGHIYRVGQGVPYRDYIPYKTVVGYYLLLPAIVALNSSWMAMLAAKAEIACLTALVLAGGALRLRRHFAPPAILGALLLLYTQSTFLERASELRVDMLSALLGLVSLLSYLERRPVLAGVAAGCAILMTQKGVYFALSLGGSAAFLLLRWRSREVLMETLRIGGAAAGVVTAYIVFWCLVGGFANVWRSMFEGPQRIAFADIYSLGRFWAQTLERNPVFYALGSASLLLLIPFRREQRDTVTERLWSYSLIHVALCIWHKQPWPYFFVMLIPTAWVSCVALLDHELAVARWWSLALGALVAVGAFASAIARVPVALGRSSVEQRHVVEAAEAFLLPGEQYLAGSELIWRHAHMPLLSWLDMVQLADIQQAPERSLEQLRNEPPRLVIDNYRIGHLPQAFQKEFQASFHAVGGNLLTYAPQLGHGVAETRFAYGGLYRVMGAPECRVSIDGGPWLAPGDQVALDVGPHQTNSTNDARLVSWSDEPYFVQQTARPDVNLFDHVYTY
jgi:hypothetical protein